MDPEEVLTRPADPPDAVVRYGSHAEAVVDLYLSPPGSPAPPPLVVFLHGGFWRAGYDRRHARPLACALARDGFLVAVPEFRRVGGVGELAGGWPTTAEDVAAAVRALPGLLQGLGLDVARTTVMGHSAGGHLALWLAGEPVPVDRVVGLAPVADLRAAAAAGLGRHAVRDLLGGSPVERAEVYDAADPATRFASRPTCEVLIVHGEDDPVVPADNSRGVAAAYPFVDLTVLDGIGHYEVIDPLSAAWPVVRAAARPPA